MDGRLLSDYVSEWRKRVLLHTIIPKKMSQGNIHISTNGRTAVNPARPTPFSVEDVLDMFVYGAYKSYGKEE